MLSFVMHDIYGIIPIAKRLTGLSSLTIRLSSAMPGYFHKICSKRHYHATGAASESRNTFAMTHATSPLQDV